MSLKDEDLAKKIEEIVSQHSQYGYRKVYAILRFRMKIPVYRNKVYEIMKKKKLLLPASTTSRKLFKGIPFNLNVGANRPNQLWGIDMTQIWCGGDGVVRSSIKARCESFRTSIRQWLSLWC